MPSNTDYHVNREFRMGGSTNAMIVAPATPRMMGKSSNHASNSSHGNNGTSSGLMPAVDVSVAGQSSSKGNRNGQDVSGAPAKQFHRKSLGDWEFLETVGAGSMGKVKLARHRTTHEVSAIKIVNRATKAFIHKEAHMTPPRTQEEILEREHKLEKEISRDKRTIREASLGQILYHPHICRLFEMCTMSNHFYMLFEYVSGGQLLDYIIQHGSLRERSARKFARGIASALQYLHMNNIVHRDLKIENIMISTSGEIKIIDFGLSNMYNPKKQLHTFCGSLYFAAPELLKACPYTGPEVDVWSFGVVLYVLVCGKVPFDDENSSVLHEKIKQGKVEYPQHLSIEVISLLSKMLVVDPSKRASLKQVVNHQWMQRGYDFPPPSYIPHRVPVTAEALDSTVIKEMYRLEFVDDVIEATAWLTRILTSTEYQNLVRQFWANVNKGGVHEDPTRAFHPLLSIYHLVDETLKRKLAKQQKRAALLAANQVPQALDVPLAGPPAGAPVTPGPTPVATPITMAGQEFPPTKNNFSANSKNFGIVPPYPVVSPPPANSPTTKTKPTVVIPPKLAVPEQAHTSPTIRKSLDVGMPSADLDVVLSPTPQSHDYDRATTALNKKSESVSYSPAPSNDVPPEKSKFGTMFRRFSQKRHSQQQSQQPQPPQPPQQSAQRFAPQPAPATSMKKTHTRTVSENVPRITTYGAPPLPKNITTAKQQTDLPALPSNAANMVKNQQQAQEGVQRLQITDEDKPLPTLAVPKGRKMHPSARAKSVGHARHESIKLMRPPVSNNMDQQVMNLNDDGFLETSDDGKSDYLNNVEVTTSQGERELTDQEILDIASKAPMGSMPSIDFPRSLFLKGFFSVQTTSSKPLPVVRYKIILVLKKLSIDFKEVKGGFVCLHKQSYIAPTTQQPQQPVILVHDASSMGSNNSGGASSHRRNFSLSGQQGSVSRHSSIRRQASINKNQPPGIAATPLGASTHERNLSVVSPGNGTGSIPEVSSASLESLNQDDILTTSKAHNLNNADNAMFGNYSKERPPLKFEIHIVKVRIVGLAGIHFKKVSGNTWMYKELASHILEELNL
ncbi:LANO_0C06788g1_1 [Lachancea nothofagi CBS 11611]|uniref:non-specific serine/threonine protein kinase n=1 Tax=Lachancea nothofagi CBS 11611 TaxID=1266666 RepID=A0A1G4J8B3_9SACH|nr:LANO_0C06788g1_1 [Lachancea nothofagi CBS 11611]